LLQYEETLNTLKYANRAKQMTPPQIPQRQEQPYNAVQEQVKVLTELQGTLVQMAKAMGKAAPREGSAPARPAAAARAGPTKRAASIGGAYGVPPRAPPAQRANSGSNGGVALGSSVVEAEEVEASMAGVRRALDELVSRQPDAAANAEVHAAYVSLDNMEGEELSAISEESAVLWREQQVGPRAPTSGLSTLRLSCFLAAGLPLCQIACPRECWFVPLPAAPVLWRRSRHLARSVG
jgi:hypothetical protein